MRCYGRWFFLTVLTTLCACGGGGSAATTTIPQANAIVDAPAAQTRSVALGFAPVLAALPRISEITGTLAFPAVSAPVTIALSASATAPAGAALEKARHPQRATLAVYEYLTVVSPVTVSLSSIPAITLHFSASTPLAGKSMYYGLSDLNAQGGLVSFDTHGPGAIAGQTVSFPPVQTAITFEAGHRYTFVVYATGTLIPPGTARKIYVVNQAGSLTTYNADGTQTSPTITAGLSTPDGVAVDAAGKIYVANYGNNSITTYNPGGTRTSPTITAGVKDPVAVAVDASGKIYVLSDCGQPCQDNTGRVTTYNSDGSASTPTITGLESGAGLAVDASGKIYVLPGYPAYSIETFTAGGAPTTPTITARLNLPAGLAVDAAGKIYVSNYGNYSNYFSGELVNADVTVFNADGSQTTLPVIHDGLDFPKAVAVDAAGSIYVANAGFVDGLYSVTTYDADGNRTTPTITAGLNQPAGIAVR